MYRPCLTNQYNRKYTIIMPENPYILGAMLQEDPLLISPSLVEAIYFRLLTEMKKKENDYLRYDVSDTGYPVYRSFVLAMVLEVFYRLYSMKGFVIKNERAFITNKQEIIQEIPVIDKHIIRTSVDQLEKLGYVTIRNENLIDWKNAGKEMEDYQELRIVINFDNIKKDLNKLRYRRKLNIEQMKKNFYYKRHILDAQLKTMGRVRKKIPKEVVKGGNSNGRKKEDYSKSS